MGKGSFKKVAIATGIAAALGYVAGILTAPQSGKETREDIKHVTKVGVAEAEKRLKSALSELNTLLDLAKQESAKMSAKARAELVTLTDGASAARTKVRELLSALHEGGTEDEDLRKAIEEADLAIKHLKTYLKK